MSRCADCSRKSPVPWSSLWRNWSFRKTPQRQKVPEYIYLLFFMSRSKVPPSTFFSRVVVKVMLTVRVNGWPAGIALTCIIHFMVFEEQLTGTGQVIIAVLVSLQAPLPVCITPVSLPFFYSLQRTIATKSRLERPVKTEAALKWVSEFCHVDILQCFFCLGNIFILGK